MEKRFTDGGSSMQTAYTGALTVADIGIPGELLP